jgi:hypothetical protein
MLTTIEAEIDVSGEVTFLEPLNISKKSRAIITLLDDERPQMAEETGDKGKSNSEQIGKEKIVHPLTQIAELAIDTGITDLAERHDFYAHGKLEE